MRRCRQRAGVLLACSGVLSAAPAIADTTNSRALSVGVDLGFRAARDDLIVPLASSGPTLGFGGRFLGKAGPGLVDTGIRFEFGALFDRYNHPAAGVLHALRLGYLPLARTRPSDWSLALGPLLVWETDVLWLRSWDDAHAYWIGRRYLGLAVRLFRPLWPTWRLDVSAEINLLGFEARPPGYRLQNQDALTQVAFYFADVNRDAKFGSVFDWQALRLEADLSRTLGPRGKLGGNSFGVETRLAHSASPASAFVFELNLRYAYAWNMP
ncbi:MAG TPA: hypothetical protein VER11_31675 [Polyangiaceae bacterium]|nr:hypothetical protein [Polyangiaceae bacterium]